MHTAGWLRGFYDITTMAVSYGPGSPALALFLPFGPVQTSWYVVAFSMEVGLLNDGPPIVYAVLSSSFAATSATRARGSA